MGEVGEEGSESMLAEEEREVVLEVDGSEICDVVRRGGKESCNTVSQPIVPR
jgi:hypothetical protein